MPLSFRNASPGSYSRIRAIRNVNPVQPVPVVRPKIEAVVLHFPKHQTAWEKNKETEVARLTGRLKMIPVDQHRISPQGSFKETPIRKPEDGGTISWDWNDINFRNTKTRIIDREIRSYGRRGRNDRYKDRTLRAQGSGLTRAVNATF